MTGISNLGQALDQISRLKSQQVTLDNFSTQIATGKKTQQFSGLGGDVMRSQRARADLNKLDQYSDNIKNAHRRIGLMNNSLEMMQSQANNLLNGLTSAPQGGEYPDFATTKQLATDVYDYLVDLVNMKDGDRYLFAGSDSSIKPIAENSNFQTYLGTLRRSDDLSQPSPEATGMLGEWDRGNITTDEFIQAYRNVDENILGYSTALVSGTTGDVRVRVDENSDFDYTMLGNHTAIKDLIIAVGVLKDMPGPENAPGNPNMPTPPATAAETPPFPSAEQQENFYAVINDLGQMIARAVDKLDQESYRLSLVEAQTETIQQQYTYQKNALQSVVSDVEDVDLTETVAKIQQVQLGLEASYSVTALISDLSLVNFLSR
jgi:flagellin-like hook-associated protein FlgL